MAFTCLCIYVSINQALGAPVQITGFETGSSSDDIQSSGGTFSITSSSPISGTYSFRSNPTTTALGYIQLTGLAADGTKNLFNIATMGLRFNYRPVTLPASGSEEIINVSDSGSSRKLGLRQTSTGALAVYDNANSLVATCSTILTANTTYRIGIKIPTSASAAAYQVDINGVTDATCNGTGLFRGVNAAFVWIGKDANISSQTMDLYFDDFVVDDAGIIAGAGAILNMVPDSNGATQQWTVGTGSADYLEIDEMPTDGDTTYVQKSAASSQTSLMGLASAATSGITGRVTAIKAYASCKEVTAVTSATSIRIASGGSNSDSSTLNGTTAYQTQQRVISTDPATGTEITLANLNSMEIGAIDTAATDQVRCSTFRLFVDVNNSAPPLGNGAGQMLLSGVGQ